MNFEQLDARVSAMKDELIADLKRWISVPSVLSEPVENAPFGAETRRMLDMALADARKYGFPTRDFDGYAGDISLGTGEQTMGMLCHLDVVPVGDDWKHDPWGGEIEDGKLYGRGAIDDKGPALCALYAMRAVRDCGIPLKDGVRLILGCDEETGMQDMRYYASREKMPDYGFSPDAEFPVINIEKGGLNLLLSKYVPENDESAIQILSLYAGVRPNVVPGIAKAVVKAKNEKAFLEGVEKIAKARDFRLTAEKSGDEITLTAEGTSVHASMPQQGKNAAGMLLIALSDLNAGGAIAPAIHTLAEKVGVDYTGEGLGIRQEDELSGPLTCNLGILRYDGHYLSAELDIRYPLCANEKEMLGNAAMAVSESGMAVTRLGGHGPLHVPAEHKVVRGLIEVYHDVTGLPGYAFAIGGGTYSRMMPNTVAFGLNFPGDVDVCHTPDEYIDIEKMMLGVKIFAHAIATLAGGEN